MKFITITLSVFLFFGCFSEPKNYEIRDKRQQAEYFLEEGKKALFNGQFQKSKNYFSQGKTIALSVDDASLISSFYLAELLAYLSFNSQEHGEEKQNLVNATKNILHQAETWATQSNNKELLALCSLYKIRFNLLFEKNLVISNLIQQAEKNRSILQKRPYNLGTLDFLIGDLYKGDKKYSMAEKYYKRAIRSFEKSQNLSELALCWYHIGQVRSLGGNKKEALDAIKNAISYDRKAENSYGLGLDYYILGIILTKGSPSLPDKTMAKNYFLQSAIIFDSAGFIDLGERSRLQANSINL
ncbi:MAG: hypothetical protein E7062_01250 [Spirochaetaceae bacterium]|nr:hypothetical protein [Spirochaetaceae bacterium]